MSACGDAGDLPRRWIDAWNAGDGDALASLYADDGSYTDMPTGIVVSGVPAITGFVIELSRNLVRDMRWELRGGTVTAERAFVEWSWSATNTGLVPGDAAAGRSFGVQGVTAMRAARITRLTRRRDRDAEPQVGGVRPSSRANPSRSQSALVAPAR